MSSARYTPVSRDVDADAELDAAFESDDDADDGRAQTHEPTSAIPGAYDFEREYNYDYPPPGSPPVPTARALPNDYGNSNGLLPSSSSSTPIRPSARPSSLFRRAVGALLPSHYVRVPNEDTSRVVGAGTDNDGVFANVVAKPQPAQPVIAPDGSIFLATEDTQKEVPPSYADAQADAVPPYWDTTVHLPPSLSSASPHGPSDPSTGDLIIDDLPTGNPWLFLINAFISFFFQFVGFLFTYLLHTTHAAKYGSRAGLGLTLIQFGFYSKGIGLSTGAGEGDDGQMPVQDNIAPPAPSLGATAAPTPSSLSFSTPAPMPDDTLLPAISSRDWLAFLFMTLGWFILLSSLISYWRLKRWERSIRLSSASAAESVSNGGATDANSSARPPPLTPEAVERDIAIRRNIASVFGVTFSPEEEAASQAVLNHARALQIQVREDAVLARDLRVAGLL